MIKALYHKNKSALWAGFGAMMCITIISFLTTHTHELWLMAPFGATMVILFGLPTSPLAQPRNIICGHIITATIGLIILEWIGLNEWSLGLAVGLSVLIMMLTNTIHPPAGANPLVIMLAGESWSFLLSPVASGAILIVLIGYVYHRTISNNRYPVKWF